MKTINLTDDRLNKIENDILINETRLEWLKEEIKKTQAKLWDLRKIQRRLIEIRNNEKYESEEMGEWGARRKNILNIVK